MKANETNTLDLTNLAIDMLLECRNDLAKMGKNDLSVIGQKRATGASIIRGAALRRSIERDPIE